MNSVALTAVSSTSLVASGALWFLMGYRYSTQYLTARTPVFLIGMIFASLSLVLSTASVLLLKSNLVRLALHFVITSVLLATYNTRLWIMLNFVKFSYFEKKRYSIPFFSSVFLFSCAFNLSPLFVLFFKPKMAAAAMGFSTSVTAALVFLFCLYVFRLGFSFFHRFWGQAVILIKFINRFLVYIHLCWFILNRFLDKHS